MSQKGKEEYCRALADMIVELYHVDRRTADEAIRISGMDKIMDDIGDYIDREPVEDWAESVWACYQRIMGKG